MADQGQVWINELHKRFHNVTLQKLLCDVTWRNVVHIVDNTTGTMRGNFLTNERESSKLRNMTQS